jgi:ABC-type lipoprotein export system ATPase subunit
MSVVVEAQAVTKQYRLGGGIKLDVLKGVSLKLQKGELVAVVGSSGSGKSTLLHILGALDPPTTGTVICNGQSMAKIPSHQRDRLRCSYFGFVFQFYHLLPDLNVLENVLFPKMVQTSMWGWLSRSEHARRRCRELLEQVGLEERIRHRPNQLSGGERQRVAIARALANDPQVLLADEPTGNLDKRTGQGVLGVIKDLHHRGQTIVLVTHDPDVARQADRVLHLEDGRLKGA